MAYQKTYHYLDDDVDQTDEDTSRGKGRRKLSENEQRLSAAVAEVAARNRRPEYDAEVRVSHTRPWSLRDKPKGYKPRKSRAAS